MEHRRLAGKVDGECVKMSLQSRINAESASSRIHAGHKLTVLDDSERESAAIVPMAVVHELAYNLMWLHGSKSVHLGHVQVVSIIDQASIAARTVCLAAFSFEGFLESLKQIYCKCIIRNVLCGTQLYSIIHLLE